MKPAAPVTGSRHFADLWYLDRVQRSWSSRASACIKCTLRWVLLSSVFLVSGRAHAFEHRHSVGIGYQSGHIATDEAGSFHFRSFPLAYLGRFGGPIGAELRIATLFPLRARQEDIAFAPRAEYDRTQQYDALVAANYRFSEILGWELESGLGPHFHYVRFQSTEYVEWSSAAMGLGISTTGRTPISEEFWGGHGELGVRGDISYDFIDLSRGGHMNGAVQAQLLVLVGFAMGTER